MSRVRAYCFTINNYTDEDIASVMGLIEDHSARYVVCGFEVGEKGTPHIQGYVYFTNGLTRRSLSSKIPRAHIVPAKGDPPQNYEYCTKEGCFWESGSIPEPGKIAREKLDEVMNNPYENFHLYNQYRRAYRELKLAEPKTHERRLILLPFNERFVNAADCDSHIFIPGDKYDLYDGQTCVTLEHDVTIRDEVVQWIHGFPPSFKRGYEVMKFDPEVVYLLYSGVHEYEHLHKLYSKLIS